jgi:hypothetical protein
MLKSKSHCWLLGYSGWKNKLAGTVGGSYLPNVFTYD